jgi:hypothetical protein
MVVASIGHREEVRKLRIEREIHRQKRGSYGSRRMARELRRRGEPVGPAQARSLMRAAGVEARQRRRWLATAAASMGIRWPRARAYVSQDAAKLTLDHRAS